MIKIISEENLPPSNFTNHPYSSIFNSFEHETVACNIMIILKRTGNVFRMLDWNEYKEARLRDGNFTDKEKIYFDAVSPHCQSSSNALKFSRFWKK